MNSRVQIGERAIAAGFPCFIAAEVGLNHNGDLGQAHRLIDAAAKTGVDAVKFQNYRTEDFLADERLTYEYRSGGRVVRESQYAMFKRYELPPGWLPELRDHAERMGLTFFSTPTSPQGVEELVRIGVRLLKNGSDFLGHVPLLRAMADTGLPTVISTGMATLAEIDEAVRAFRAAGGRQLILLHCTSSYPTPPKDTHLRKIPTLATTFDCPTGLSDHTEGTIAAIGGVSLGACFLEKHFTLDRDLPGPDHGFSADPAEMQSLVQAVRLLENSLGESVVGPSESEAEGRLRYRLSCVAARPLPSGTRLSDGDIAFRRPGTGLPPAALSWLMGRRLTCAVALGDVFGPEHFTSEAAR